MNLSGRRKHVSGRAGNNMPGLIEISKTSLDNSGLGTSQTAQLTVLLDFERLMSDLSATFVNLPSEQVDREIERWMERLGRFLGADIGTLAQFSDDLCSVRFTHVWALKGIEALGGRPPASRWRWMWEQIKRGRIVRFTNVMDLPEEAAADRDLFIEVGCISHVSIPLAVGGTIIGILSFNCSRAVEAWPDEYVERFRLLGDVIANALMRKRSDKALKRAFQEIKTLKDQLEAENVYLRQQVKLSRRHDQIIGESPALQEVLIQVEQVAGTDSTVFIQGETGTGKELIADAIHRLSHRADRPLVKVNCAAIPSTLIESELFGREKGAYTGAVSREIGRFESAHLGTLLLDEIGELPLEVQGKLLRVLQDGRFERLGSSKSVAVDVRVIACTNRDIQQAVRSGLFRPDLFYRLNVFTITAPPLRKRKEDIPGLVRWFVAKFAAKMDKKIETIPRQTLLVFQHYNWPGNVRELMNAVERSVILTRGNILEACLPMDISPGISPIRTLAEAEREHIVKVLELTAWRVRGKAGAAELLGMKPTTLESRMAKLGIRRRK